MLVVHRFDLLYNKSGSWSVDGHARSGPTKSGPVDRVTLLAEFTAIATCRPAVTLKVHPHQQQVVTSRQLVLDDLLRQIIDSRMLVDGTLYNSILLYRVPWLVAGSFDLSAEN